MNKLLFAFSVLLSFSVSAQEDTTANTLNEVIVTANKIEQKQKETGKILTVVTKEQLQQNSSRLLTEVLNEQTGIIVNGSANNLGSNQSVYMRGANPGNTLILVDGIPVYDASGISSEFDLNYLNINQIERIEILKGAQSTLYGSDAVAGVINIITKKNIDKNFSGFADVSAGSYNTFNGAAGIYGKQKKISYNIGYSYIQSGGFSSAYDSTGSDGFDKDKFSQQTLNTSLGFDVSNNLKLRIFSLLSGYKADVDAAAFTDDKDYIINNKNLQTGSAANFSLGSSKFTFNYQYNNIKRAYTDDSTDIGSFATYQKGDYKSNGHFAELYGNFKFNNHIMLTAGTDYRRNSSSQFYFLLSPFGPYTPPKLSDDSAKTDQYSLYAQVLLKSNSRINVEAGGRLNNHSVYGWNATYSFTPSYNINDNLKLLGTIASAYRTPSLYQLYGEYGNKKLNPEQSVTYEAGIEYASKCIQTRVDYFKRNISDAIKFYTDYTTYISYYVNADKQKDKGVEAELTIKPCHSLTVSANYTFIDGEIITTSDVTPKDTAYFNLYRRPKNVFNVSVNWQASKKLLFTTHFRTVSKYFEGVYAAPPQKLKGYYTINVYGEYKPSAKFTLFADAKNITNQQYFDIPGYNSKRFNVMAGGRINF